MSVDGRCPPSTTAPRSSTTTMSAAPIWPYGTPEGFITTRPVPLTRELTPEEVGSGYERETATVILEAVGGRLAEEVPAVLVRGHGPFCWGATPAKAVEVAETLESVAEIAWLTVVLEPGATALPGHVVSRHFTRKHGPDAYYGQK